MRHIRKLEEQDLYAFAKIVVDAYPGIPSTVDDTYKRFIKVHNEDPTVSYYGLYEDENLVGGMRFHDFEMNLYGKMIPVGGVGSVAVDLLHKKKKIAKDLITYFIQHYRERGVKLLSLYPFRPSFYKQMGFGLGSRMEQYRVVPSSFPLGPSKSHLRYLTKDDKERIRACHRRFVNMHHGMYHKTEMELNGLLDNPNIRIVGYVDGDEIHGYMSFVFRKAGDESFMRNNIHILELIYENRNALLEMFTFLHSQADQIERVVLNTQDKSIYHILSDPRNGTERLIPSVYHETNTAGVGLMYRVVDVASFMQLLDHHAFGHETISIKWTINDSFMAEQTSLIVQFNNGVPTISDNNHFDVELTLDIADFSTLLMGAIPFDRLYMYGLVNVSDTNYVDRLSNLFNQQVEPICMSAF